MPDGSEQSKRPLRSTRKGVAIALVLLVLLGIGFAYGTLKSPPFAKDAQLTKTTPPTRSALFTSATWLQRLWWKYYELKKTYHPNPLSYTFNATGGLQRCSIHGLLNQSMETGGTQYFIEKNVAAGSVDFGHTNVLNGAQWIHAFESALQTNTPEWWDPERKNFRHENLVLLRYGNRITLVLSEAKAKQYQEKYPRLEREEPR